MNDKTTEDLLPPDDLAPESKSVKKKKVKKTKTLKIRNISNKDIKGYNCIYRKGDEFEIAAETAEMLISRNRCELVSNANKDEST